MPVILHTSGPWPPSQVSSAPVPSSLAFPPDVQARIDAEWLAHESAARAAGRLLFDGPMSRLESVDDTAAGAGGGLRFTHSPTSYKPFFVLHLLRPAWSTELLIPPVRPIGVSTLLLTADHMLLLGRRSPRVAYHPGLLHPIAGALEPADAGDLFAASARELHEELRLSPHEFHSPLLLGLIEDPALQQPEFVLSATTPLTSQSLRARLNTTEHAAEHTALESIPATPESLHTLLSADTALTPVATGALRLYATTLPLSP